MTHLTVVVVRLAMAVVGMIHAIGLVFIVNAIIVIIFRIVIIVIIVIFVMVVVMTMSVAMSMAIATMGLTMMGSALGSETLGKHTRRHHSLEPSLKTGSLRLTMSAVMTVTTLRTAVSSTVVTLRTQSTSLSLVSISTMGSIRSRNSTLRHELLLFGVVEELSLTSVALCTTELERLNVDHGFACGRIIAPVGGIVAGWVVDGGSAAEAGVGDNARHLGSVV